MEPQKKQRNEKRFFLSLFIIVLILFAVGSLYNNHKTGLKASETTSEEAVDVQPIKGQSAPENVQPSASQEAEQVDSLSMVSGIVYRHLVAYNLVCTEAGMPLKKYPEYFSKKYAPEIQAVNVAWVRRGKSLESVLTDYDSLIYPKTQADIKKELLNIERDFVKAMKAKDAGITPDKIEWTEEQESKLNLADACMVFDEAAEGIVEKAGFENMFREMMNGL